MATDGSLEFDSYLDQEQAKARDWYADTFRHAPEHLMLLTNACADDDPRRLKRLGSKHLDCVQRLALLKLHELTAAYKLELKAAKEPPQ